LFGLKQDGYPASFVFKVLLTQIYCLQMSTGKMLKADWRQMLKVELCPTVMQFNAANQAQVQHDAGRFYNY